MAPPTAAVSHADSTTYVDLLVVKDVEDGILNSIGISRGKNEHYYRITIDNEGLIDRSDEDEDDDQQGQDKYFHKVNSSDSNDGMGLDLEFSDLKVEIKDGIARSASTRFWAVYDVLGATPSTGDDKEDDAEPEIEKANGFVHARYEDFDHLDFVKMLQGREYQTEVVLKQDTYVTGQPISGKLVCRDWRGDRVDFLPDDEVKLSLTVDGRQYTLGEEYLEATQLDSGELPFKELQFEEPMDFSLQSPGEYELKAEVSHWANYPATLTLL